MNTNPAGSLIQFDPNVFDSPQTITLTTTLTLSESSGAEMIEGPVGSPVTLSGNHSVGVVLIDKNVTATLTNLTVTQGYSTSGGGGIANMGTLTMAGDTITSNSAIGYSGGGGGAENFGTMTISDSTISSNVAEVGGGGIFNDGVMTVAACTVTNNMASGNIPRVAPIGGGILNSGTLTVTGSLIEANSADGGSGTGGGICAGNGISVIDISDSTIADNTAGAGGGLLVSGATTLVDSTIAGNQGGGIFAYKKLTVINSTIADNTINLSPIAGGLTIAEGTATLDNTIVALNTNTGDGSVRASDVVASTDSGIVSTSSAYNLIGSGGSGGLSNGVNGNQVGITNPGLGPLASNGGPTPTIGLLPGSPAIDRGSNALDDGLVTDQRGAGFVRVYNNIVDIGAYEFQPAVIAVSVTWNTQTAGAPDRGRRPSFITGGAYHRFTLVKHPEVADHVR